MNKDRVSYIGAQEENGGAQGDQACGGWGTTAGSLCVGDMCVCVWVMVCVLGWWGGGGG